MGYPSDESPTFLCSKWHFAVTLIVVILLVFGQSSFAYAADGAQEESEKVIPPAATQDSDGAQGGMSEGVEVPSVSQTPPTSVPPEKPSEETPAVPDASAFAPGTLVVSQTDGVYRAVLSGTQVSTITNVAFAIWSEVDGQDDLHWYDAYLQADGTYSLDIPVSAHNSLGLFYVDAYAGTSAGVIYLSSATFAVPKPSLSGVAVSALDASAGTFTLTVSGVVNADLIRKVRIAVWTSPDQSDLYWYTATAQPDGTYLVSGNLSYHKYHTGIYSAHVYLDDVAGHSTFVDNAVMDMSITAGTFVATPHAAQGSLHASLQGFKVPGGCSNVAFAVWSAAGGQDDLRWYDVAQQPDGTYVLDILVANHRSDGQYFIDAYAGSSAGPVYLNTATATIKTTANATLDIYSVDRENGWFAGRLQDVDCPVGISSVKVAVWQAADQRDLRWITLDRQADGTFTFADFVEYHMRFFGPYTFHAYATLGNGVQTCIATAQADVMPYNYVVADRLSSSRCRVSVYNPNGGDATVVMFPTWAQAKGRECTAWYQGINNGDGSFSTIIDARNHNASGTFYTDVQVSSTDGSTRVVKSVAYELDLGYTHRVPALFQNPELPTGCESVALTIVLRSMGYILGKTTIADYYLPRSDWDFVTSFLGDPRNDSGAGAFPPAIVGAANTFLSERGDTQRAYEITGSSMEALYGYIDQGYPVLVWNTMYMLPPLITDTSISYNGRTYTWYGQEHCVVMYGYNRDTGMVLVSDPLEGIVWRNAWQFGALYYQTGSNSVVIL
ncbi:MAG: GBS Bsp-like repeat-containing protein [Raoultibacter sp.]